MKGGVFKLADNEVVDGIINKILSPILEVIKWIVGLVFSSRTSIMLVFLLIINAISIILMKRDKEYAQRGERRIREITLLLVAIMGGSLGMYYAMFKYKHKTLHNKFRYGVPLIILIQFAYIAYVLMRGILCS